MSLGHRLLDRPHRMLERAYDSLGHHKEPERPYKTAGGLVLLVVVGLIAVWIFPELRRYIRIERM